MNRKPTTSNTQREVDAAADKLLRAGIRPTVQNVLDAIGGSPRGVRAMLEDWRNRLAKRAANDSRAGPALPEERAEQIVRQAIDDARGSLRERIKTTRKRLSKMVAPPAEGARRDSEGVVSREMLARIQREVNSLHAQLAALVEVFSTARVEAAALEKRAGDLKHLLRHLQAEERLPHSRPGKKS